MEPLFPPLRIEPLDFWSLLFPTVIDVCGLFYVFYLVDEDISVKCSQDWLDTDLTTIPPPQSLSPFFKVEGRSVFQ